MLQAPGYIRKINYGAVAQIFSETRTVDLHHHPVGGSLRMLLQKKSNITVGSYAGNVYRRQELFPLIGRADRKNFTHFPCKLSVVFCAGSRAYESGILKQIRPVHRITECFPFAIERTSEEDPAHSGFVQA